MQCKTINQSLETLRLKYRLFSNVQRSLLVSACIWLFIIPQGFASDALSYAKSNVQHPATSEFQEKYNKQYHELIMNASALMPRNTKHRNISCKVNASETPDYRGPDGLSNSNLFQTEKEASHLTSAQANYSDSLWHERIASDFDFFTSSVEKVDDSAKILVIDIVETKSGPAYRYLANHNSQNTLYEPWSSSKIFAATGALAMMNQRRIPSQTIGDSNVADMITSINSYMPFGTSPDNSNALATLFANIAGRDFLSDLFHDGWLKVPNDQVFFRGAYGPDTHIPDNIDWPDITDAKLVFPFSSASDDPGYRPYRCENCGLTGNKPMTSLSQAEWLKRLAMHDRDANTQHPHLTSKDIEKLFYGTGNSVSDSEMAGMSAGISHMLGIAIAHSGFNLNNESSYSTENNSFKTPNEKEVEQSLDNATDGNWRIFQKIGWGPSETRGKTEVVVLAHVCLPMSQTGFNNQPLSSAEFTIAAQVSVDGAKEANLALAGQKMQRLLTLALKQYFDQKRLK